MSKVCKYYNSCPYAPQQVSTGCPAAELCQGYTNPSKSEFTWNATISVFNIDGIDYSDLLRPRTTPISLNGQRIISRETSKEEFRKKFTGDSVEIPKEKIGWTKMKVKLDAGATKPIRAHADDAGLDLYARYGGAVIPGKFSLFETGVHVQIPKGYVGLVKSRSGLMKHGITADGTIDSGYTGSIKVVLFNHSDSTFPFPIEQGDRIAQLVIVPCVTEDVELVSSLEETERGENGFGSSGR